jgi:hemerythrin-like metal-binding protein
MSDYYVPYGSQQSQPDHGMEFFMPWVKELVTQSEELNVEHVAVLQKLNALLHALDSGDANRIAMACDVLAAEAKAHFDNEDELMLATGYPDRTAHLEQHDELMRGIARIRFAMTSNIGHWSPVGELSMLERWFVPHLTHADRRFADFMAARRAASDAA